MNENVAKKMNEQMGNEFHAAYVYLAISSYFESQGLKGMAQWMKGHAKEEQAHALKFYQHLLDRGKVVSFPTIPEVKVVWKSALEAARAAYEHELLVTSQINAIFGLVRSEKDYAAESLMQWFSAEQVEEEAITLELVQKLEMADGKPVALMAIDREYASKKD